MLWLLEQEVFGAGDHPLTTAARRAGHRVLTWQDAWWSSPKGLPPETDERVVFHGSLANAARVAELGRWHPGAYCATSRLACSAWYPRAAAWLANPAHVFSTVRDFVADPEGVTAPLQLTTRYVFARPDSPLKPFSGRVVPLDGLTAAHLDHGFYYEELDLPIVLAPEASFGNEWRFIVAERRVVASSAYEAAMRRAAGASVPNEAHQIAERILAILPAPDPVFVLDLVEAPDGIRLLELNPFSGADLYDCNPDDVVTAVAALP